MYRDGILCADSQMTWYTQAGPSLKWSDGYFKIISNGEGLFGGTGAIDGCQEFMKWVLGDMDPKDYLRRK